MPHYFSGTKARAWGWAQANSANERIVEMRLYLGGELVSSWVEPPNAEPAAGGGLGVRFDSSHFMHGTQLEVKMWARNQWGATDEDTASAPVKNRAVGFSRHEFTQEPGGNGVGEFATQIANLNYDVWTTSSPSWDVPDILNELAECTVYYESTHGNPNSHGTSQPPGWPHICAVPTPAYHDYLTRRQEENGDGLPPFNSTSNPYVALCYMCHCNSGLNNNFSSLLWPYDDAYGQYVKGQSNIAWGGYTLSIEDENQVWWIFHKMRLGWTAKKARDNFLYYNAWDHPRKVRISEWERGPWRLAKDAPDCPVYGDFWTRIKKVYMGSNVLPSTDWFVPILY